jgi:hypothetical protein
MRLAGGRRYGRHDRGVVAVVALMGDADQSGVAAARTLAASASTADPIAASARFA